MGSIFQTGPAMGNLFSAGPQFLGQVGIAGTSDIYRRRKEEDLAGTSDVILYRTRKEEDDLSGPSDVFRRHPNREVRVYCDPSVDPLCSNPYEGPIPVTLQGNDRSFYAGPSERETPPNLNCNIEWDPSCPRPRPNRTMVPYVPSSYMRGAEPLVIGNVEFTQPALGRTALRQRKG